MIIDCGTCVVRPTACADCVVTFLTVPVRDGVGPPGDGPEASVLRSHASPAGVVRGTTRTSSAPVAATDLASGRQVDLDEAERDAIDVLARSGLVPPLRLIRPA